MRNSGRILIVNADDFGISHGVNRGIIEAHERGIVTSASLMVRWPAAEEAAEYARSHPDLGLGLHLDLGEWIFREGQWSALYDVVPLDDPDAVRAESRRQLEQFHRLTGRDPDHLDSHQHAHCDEPVRSIVIAGAKSRGIPLRHFSSAVQYCGGFYGQDEEGNSWPQCISPQGLMDTLRQLPSDVTELACHPGYARDLDTMYLAEREQEVRTLCDPAVRQAIEQFGIGLATFAQVRLLRPG